MSAVASTLKRKGFLLTSVTFFFFLSASKSEFIPCSSRSYEAGKIVCVCNETYCDSIGKITLPYSGLVSIFETSLAGARFTKTTGSFTKKRININVLKPAATVVINRDKMYQKILGFGGAFTDSAGINIKSLPLKLQEEIIKGYYSEEGLDYNIGRVPMAGCDFSTRKYSYCDVPGDFKLVHFELAPEDLQFKIPLMHQALNVSKKPLLFFGTPWSSPYWMKTNNDMAGGGVLKGDVNGPYYNTWANYFVKFLQAYQEHNISFWGLTAENEPTFGYVKNFSSDCLGFTPELQRDFIRFNLGPALKRAGYGPDKIKLMIMDDERTLLPNWAEIVLGNADAAGYVSGVAFHWYNNTVTSPEVLDQTHRMFPTKFLLSTEACEGFKKNPSVDIGSWHRAEKYAHDIMEDLQHFTVGWVDWNLALDVHGGPNWVKNFVDSPILVNASANEFLRQPMYYALGHFSKFLPKGTFRIGLNVPMNTPIELAAFKRPDDSYVLITLNRNSSDVILTIRDPNIGYITHNVAGHSIQSYIWRN